MAAEPVLELTCELIGRASVTPHDAGCQRVLAERLAGVGFEPEHMRFGEVDNLWARRGDAAPTLCFAGHTDVVPAGPAGAWDSEPFRPDLRDGKLYGRGAADMKGSLAAMTIAIERFVADNADHAGSIAVLLTSDEEGPALDGTDRVMERLEARGELPTWCVVGEPSCHRELGDVARVGRRGSLNGRLIVRGIQGHVAYPHLARNPLHEVLPALTELAMTEWDAGNEHFPPTSFQISNLTSGTGATNVIPGTLEALFNFRHSTEFTADELRARVEAKLHEHGLADFELEWQRPSPPFLSEPGQLAGALAEAVQAGCGVRPTFDTKGGTSDGRFIAPRGVEVVEFGPVNASIHKVNEHVLAADLPRLSDVYLDLMRRLLG